MKNIKEVRDELGKVFEGLRDGSLKVPQAAEMNNAAGKILNSVKVELDYYALRKETPKIEFLDT
jgi:hypothetical protein